MREISSQKLKEMRREISLEFPGDKMMQELHLIRWIEYLKTREMSTKEKLDYYNQAKQFIGSKPRV